jgi:hypothetical protein
MPTAAPRRCARCGQPAPKGKGCPCRPPFEGSIHPGNTRRWSKTRAAKLRANPICQHPGCRHVATEVDHVQPLSQGGDRFDWSNLASLCRQHHQVKSTADALAGKRRLR